MPKDLPAGSFPSLERSRRLRGEIVTGYRRWEVDEPGVYEPGTARLDVYIRPMTEQERQDQGEEE